MREILFSVPNFIVKINLALLVFVSFSQTFIPENLFFFFYVTHIYQPLLLIRNNREAIVKMEIQRGNSFQCFRDILFPS